MSCKALLLLLLMSFRLRPYKSSLILFVILVRTARCGCHHCQVDQADRGFSFSKAAPLDMRMGPSAPASAEHIVNTWSESELGQIFREYGEERHWKGIASRY